MSLTFITGNKGKFKEALDVIPDLVQNNIDLVEIQSLDSREIIKYKLEEARKHSADDIIVEDISLSFDCLNGLPGPLIKWFSKAIGNDGLYKLVESLNNFGATAKVTIGLSKIDGTIELFEGEINGVIVSPRGEKGFGWDPIFQADGEGKTYGEMTFEEKNKVSSRKIAFEKLRDYLHTQK